MNRRRLLTAALPFFFGSAALRASAQESPTLKPRRIRIEVSLLKPGLALGETNAQIIVLTTEENIETDAMFLQTHTFREDKPGGREAFQNYGPKLSVTAHAETDGRIHLAGRIDFEEATATAAPNAPLPVSGISLLLNRTVTDGQAVTLGGVVVNKIPQTIQLTATVL